MTDVVSTVIGQTLGDKYRVRRLIGSGGMGAVYEVEHTFTRRVGALKLLHQTYAGQSKVVERFIREASAAGRIGNAHIVETMDAGRFPSGEPYMFMELLTGSPVNDLVASRGRLQLGEAVEIAAQAAEGLAAAHAMGIVHRDIKPENLFLCAGDKPFIKILDFGISKFAPGDGESYRLTAEGAALGTPYYMSPEQVLGSSNVDARTDVYSLGVVLYECLTGQVPFQADALPALSVKIHSGEYAPLSTLRHDVPRDLEAVVSRAMATDPEARFQSVAAFRDALLSCQTLPAVSLAPTLFDSLPPPGATVIAAPTGGVPALTARPAGSTTAGVASDAYGRFPSPDRAARKPSSMRQRVLLVSVGLALVGGSIALFSGAFRQPSTLPMPDAAHGIASSPRVLAASPARTAPARPAQVAIAPASSLAVPSASADLVAQAPSAKARVLGPPTGAGKNPLSRGNRSKAAQDGLSVDNPF